MFAQQYGIVVLTKFAHNSKKIEKNFGDFNRRLEEKPARYFSKNQLFPLKTLPLKKSKVKQ